MGLANMSKLDKRVSAIRTYAILQLGLLLLASKVSYDNWSGARALSQIKIGAIMDAILVPKNEEYRLTTPSIK